MVKLINLKAAEEEAKLEMQKKEMCMQAKEIGPCDNHLERYYFDTSMGKCIKFDFGGCFGNDNNFESIDECESTCHMLIESAVIATPMMINMGIYFIEIKLILLFFLFAFSQ